MTASYIPRGDSERVVWLGNFVTALPVQAKSLGVPAAEQKDALDGAKALIDAIQTDEQKRAEWMAATARTEQLKQQILPEIQRVIDRLRTAPGFTAEVDKALMAVPPKGQTLAVEEYKPVIRGAVVGGKVRLSWTRGELDGINVYGRKQGEQAWVLLGRDNRPPFDDTRPAPATVEVREYRAVGVLKDEEVGQPSDIISVSVGG